MQSELKNNTITAVLWSFAEKFGQQLLYLLTGVIVARLVAPTEYGMVGLLGIFVAIPTILSESGLSASLIRQKTVSPADYAAVFSFNMAISVTLYVALFFGAPFIADFYDLPPLVPIARVQFLAILFSACALVQYVELSRRLAFKLMTKINLLALLLSSLTSVFLALSGAGVWALVMQQVLFAFLRMLGLWFYGSWQLSFSFRLDILRRFWSFSANMLFVSLLNAFANNLYAMLIGKVYSSAEVGYYTQANKYQEIPSNIVSNSFRSIMFPILSKVNDDRTRALQVLRRMLSMVSFLTFPCMFFLAFAARPFIVFLISDIWLPSVSLFAILCFAGAWLPFTILLGDSLAVMGRSDIMLRYDLVRKSFLFLGVLVLYSYGIRFLAYWWIAYMLFSVLLSMWFVRKVLDYNVFLFFSDIKTHLLSALGWAYLASLTTPYFDHDITQLIGQGLIVSVGYLTTLWLLKDATLLEINLQARQKWMRKK